MLKFVFFALVVILSAWASAEPSGIMGSGVIASPALVGTPGLIAPVGVGLGHGGVLLG